MNITTFNTLQCRYVSVNDFEKLMPRSHQPPVSMEYTLITQEKRSLASGLLEGVYRFSLAAVGGGEYISKFSCQLLHLIYASYIIILV